MATDRQLVREFKSIGKDELGYEGQQLAEFVERSLREHKQQLATERAKELELARIMVEVEEKAREREHTLAMERQRLEAEFRRGENRMNVLKPQAGVWKTDVPCKSPCRCLTTRKKLSTTF
ncbi:hypothetical protein ACJMK2_034983 [Sinanodonta woodiana]|uniref:DivIVA domain-containing protein n=1 Tax=Sinanodonta woodiana TaxID=1069815 RepID=A0ABD3WTE6_SINWO